MSYQIYVGNYPTEFSEEDLNRLFLDFDGMRLVKFFKAEKKCFAFFYCVNREQAIDVCLKVNNLHVCGRKLVVRATDDELQSYIQTKVEYTSEINSHAVVNSECCVKERVSYSDMPRLEPFNVHGNSTNDFSKIDQFYAQPSIETNTDASQMKIHPQVLLSSDRNLSEMFTKYRSGGSESISRNIPYSTSNGKINQTVDTQLFSSMQPMEPFSLHAEAATNQFVQNQFQTHPAMSNYNPRINVHEAETFSDVANVDTLKFYENPLKYDFSRQNQFCVQQINNDPKYNKLNFSNFDGIDPRGQSYGRYEDMKTFENHQYQIQTSPEFSKEEFSDEKYSYVSIMNFPIGTTYEELYKLFSEFHPIQIVFKCNVARRDRTPTEAIVCFPQKQDATNAILTLDNTRFKNRIILVNDLDDLTMAMDLLSVAGKH